MPEQRDHRMGKIGIGLSLTAGVLSFVLAKSFG